MNYNKVILIGNLTKDPELRYTPQGTPVSSFSLAVNHRYKQGDDWRDEVSYVDIVVFGKQAESCSQFLSKGRAALVEGRLSQRRWESPDGQKRSKVEIVAQSVKFLSQKGGQAQDSFGDEDIQPPNETTDLEPF